MRKTNILKYTILSASLFAGAAFAGDYSSPWIFSASIGTNAVNNSTYINEQTGETVDLSAFNTGYSASRLELRGRKFGDVYESSINASFEVRYALSNLSEIFGSVGYSRAKGKDNIALGCMHSDIALATCDLNLTGSADDYEQYMLELGYRQWLKGFASFPAKPYYAVHGGVAYNKGADINLSAGTNSLGALELYEDGYSYTVGADVGASYTITRTMELAAEVGVRYTDGFKRNKNSCNYGLCDVNNTDGTITVPVSVRLNAVF